MPPDARECISNEVARVLTLMRVGASRLSLELLKETRHTNPHSAVFGRSADDVVCRDGLTHGKEGERCFPLPMPHDDYAVAPGLKSSVVRTTGIAPPNAVETA